MSWIQIKLCVYFAIQMKIYLKSLFNTDNDTNDKFTL